jgi:hypothetical protein
MNTAEMGKLGLTDAEEEAIVAFLGTLSDGYRPRSSRQAAISGHAISEDATGGSAGRP